ncbi:MAG: BolA family transcriptional regulator [Rickettsiaceae bacterium]|nr:MAG: BolA family transcriptional regulator [Rickettsiaceae bacterium]
MTRINRIKQILSALKPQYLEIVDQTPNHSKHLKPDSPPETHINLIMAADSLNNMLLVEQHRIIKDMLKQEFDTGMHALSIKIIKSSLNV